jgi:hypothetical protein
MKSRSSGFGSSGTSSESGLAGPGEASHRHRLNLSRALIPVGILALSCTAGGPPTESPIEAGGIQLASGIELEGANGADVLRLKPRESDVQLTDGDGTTIARFRIEEGRLRIREAVGGPVGFVEREEGMGFRIVEAPSGEVLYTLRAEPDGDLRLGDGNGELVYEIKARDYGFKVIDAKGQLEGKIRTKEGKISVRDAAGETVLGTRDPVPAVAVACLALRSVRLSYRAGLLLAVLHWGLGPS